MIFPMYIFSLKMVTQAFSDCDIYLNNIAVNGRVLDTHRDRRVHYMYIFFYGQTVNMAKKDLIFPQTDFILTGCGIVPDT